MNFTSLIVVIIGIMLVVALFDIEGGRITKDNYICEQEKGEEIRELFLECLDKGGWVNSCRNTAINSYCH